MLHIQRRSHILSVEGTPLTPLSVLENNEGTRFSDMKMLICRKQWLLCLLSPFCYIDGGSHSGDRHCLDPTGVTTAETKVLKIYKKGTQLN